VSEEKNVQELLRKGIEAAREQNKAEAREYLQQVVDLDDKNEKGWYWLASVVETDEERKVCLGNVLFINPNNERAKKAMEQLEAKERKSKADAEVIPGVSRRQLMLFGGGAVVVVLLILAIFVSIVNNRNAEVAAQTQAVVDATNSQSTRVAAAATEAKGATETQVAKASPTPTATNTPALVLPPTFTPTSPPASEVTPTPLPGPDPSITGRIAAWSGNDIAKTGFLPIVVLSMNGQSSQIAEAGSAPHFKPDGSKLIYTRYYAVTFDYGAEEIEVSGTNPVQVAQGLPIVKPKLPSYCAISNQVTLVAVPPGTKSDDFGGSDDKLPFQVYVLDLDTKGEPRRITNDKAQYSSPMFSPDCTKIAAVRTDLSGADVGTDVVVMDLTSLTQTPITTDRNGYVESSPRWSPDGTQLLYAAYVANQPTNNDIVVRAADGSGTPTLLIRDPSDDKNPVYSPDGSYIAFASNRSGYYNIYIFDPRGSKTYQLTNTEGENYPSSWSK
jgi:hypothetical protein